MTSAFTLPEVQPVNLDHLAKAWAQLDQKTKPPRSLGKLEELAARYVALRGAKIGLAWRPSVVVFAADHGVAAEGVSAYPQSVTEQMLANFAAGGAAINALCRAANAELQVVDVGTLGATPKGVLARKIRSGSRNFTEEPALTLDEVQAAIRVGLEIADELEGKGVSAVGLGEMGIANTTAASALTSVFTRHPVRDVVGRGTGIDDVTLARKCAVVERALAHHNPNPERPLEVLACVGGLEIAALTGLCLGAAAHGIPVILDGFITTSAALAARALCPAIASHLIASHRSVEPGHAIALGHLHLEPLLQLEMRLGEGSGAALALPLVAAAIHIWRDMATFESAGVSRAK
ncbi:MAG TPA: nicotinate-nucleotide--dimethylbenzimidazole phosphoribosyltransferase [Polyangiaceae bacterium]|jgi:nicotinate-nucleotide--dimethylbenzimidazole phosphoribosyltransferase|nr:nicotinate-nucleotide--dimethylbenzimidazole phosphoribosyltransferase [Polyangiaceae bacterium]